METDPSVLMQRIAIKADDPEQSVKNVSPNIILQHNNAACFHAHYVQPAWFHNTGSLYSCDNACIT